MSGKILSFSSGDYRLVESYNYLVGVDESGNVIYKGVDGSWRETNTYYSKNQNFRARVFVNTHGKRYCVTPARLVAETLLPEFDRDLLVYHIDGDSSNNHYSNLYQKDGAK